ncbi:hypothetical protein PG985_011409 [Apiospora marii]|uniref:uncharacterized protein n=1 Tax=Apiospora marii TaxID=335849 RepID=UPI0031311967
MMPGRVSAVTPDPEGAYIDGKGPWTVARGAGRAATDAAAAVAIPVDGCKQRIGRIKVERIARGFGEWSKPSVGAAASAASETVAGVGYSDSPSSCARCIVVDRAAILGDGR